MSKGLRIKATITRTSGEKTPNDPKQVVVLYSFDGKHIGGSLTNHKSKTKFFQKELIDFYKSKKRIKKLMLSALFIMLFTACFSQAKPKILAVDQSGEIFYEQIDSVTMKKDVIYTQAIEWVANYYKANNIIQVQDKENGKIIGLGFYQYFLTAFLERQRVDLKYTFNITVKDGKYRCQISNLYAIVNFDSNVSPLQLKNLKDVNSGKIKFSKSYADKILIPIDAEMKNIFKSLNQSVNNSNNSF
jgi:hypothetical protein